MPSVKNIGKPYAGKPHVRFDEGGQVRACSLLYPRVTPRTLVLLVLIVVISPALAAPTIRFENQLIQATIGQEVTSDTIPGLPESSHQDLLSSGCMLRGPAKCEMGMTQISFVISGSTPTRIRAVLLKRNTGKRIMLPKKIGWPGMADTPVWQIVDGFAFRDEQNPRGMINKRKPYLEMVACELLDQSDENIVAIGKVVNPVKGNHFITHLRPIYHVWRVDQTKLRFVKISPKGVECITDSEGAD